MQFHLVDRIVEVTPNQTLQAVKNLTSGEEYLADHFPRFPIMPGVLMLQALVESAAWLLRLSEDFAHSIIVLREVKNVKYGSLFKPGQQMTLSVKLNKQEGSLVTFTGKGTVEGSQRVSARFIVEQYNLKDRHPQFAKADEQIIQKYRQQALLLQRN